jgi:hypothetical protein
MLVEDPIRPEQADGKAMPAMSHASPDNTLLIFPHLESTKELSSIG